MEEYIEYNGEKIFFIITKKKMKNMILRVDVDGTVKLSMPNRMPIYKAKEFVSSRVQWILKQKEYNKKIFDKTKEENVKYFLGNKYELKIVSDKSNFFQISDDNKYLEMHVKEKYINDNEYVENLYQKLYREYAKDLFNDLVEKYQKQMGKYNIPFPTIEIRQMKSRWGTCMPTKNKIILNLFLVKTPVQCIEYVVVHELSHFKHQNHSKAFYSFLSIFMPDWNKRRKILNKEYGFVTL